jgi:hypothetical protein
MISYLRVRTPPRQPSLSVYGKTWKRGKMTNLIVAPPAETIPATVTAGTSAIGACGTSFIDGQRTPIERLPIQAGNRPLKARSIRQLDKAEAAGRPRHPVADYHGGGHWKARTRYKIVKNLIRSTVR